MARRLRQQLLQANQPIINRNRQNEGALRWLDETAGTLHLNPDHANPRTAVRVVTKAFQDKELFITPQGRPAPLLENTITPQAMQFVQSTAQTRFKLKVLWDLVLYNNETDEEMNFYDRRPTSPWFDNMTDARHWFEQVEEDRLQGHMQLPNTKFSYGEHTRHRGEDPAIDTASALWSWQASRMAAKQAWASRTGSER